MLSRIDRIARKVASWLLALIGIGFCFLSEWLIRLAAALADVHWEDE